MRSWPLHSVPELPPAPTGYWRLPGAMNRALLGDLKSVYLAKSGFLTRFAELHSLFALNRDQRVAPGGVA